MSACSDPNVVVQPVALKPVAEKLLKVEPLVQCEAADTDSYTVQELLAIKECWRAQAFAKHSSFDKLSRVVRIRQAAAARALKAAR